MSQFLTHYKVYLTPLTPIHIGCGEDFEPTNYTIKDDVLYHFEPSRLAFSPAKRAEFSSCVAQADLLKIQRFFKENQLLAIESAHYFADVSEGVADDWQKKIGNVVNRESDNNKVICNLAIERAAYLLDKHQAYIPGSSFKGAMATALLDKQHQLAKSPKPDYRDKNASNKFVKEFIGEFANSKLRTVKFSDFMPSETLSSKIYYSLNVRKKPKDNGKDEGITLRRECISGGQYRALQSELTLWKDSKITSFSLAECVKSLNDYYIKAFKKEMVLLYQRALVNKKQFDELSHIIDESVKLPNVALIRLGKAGADSKVYSTPGIASIKIMLGKQDKTNKDSATTLWLAGNNEKQPTDLLPFGWALVEIKPFDDHSENVALKKWCEQQPKSAFDKQSIIAAKQARKEEEARKLAEEKAKEEERLRQEQEKAQFKAQLNENQILVFALVEKFHSSNEKQDDINSALFREVKALVELATQSWSSEDKAFIQTHLDIELIKTRIVFKKKDGEKNFKKLLNKLGNDAA